MYIITHKMVFSVTALVYKVVFWVSGPLVYKWLWALVFEKYSMKQALGIKVVFSVTALVFSVMALVFLVMALCNYKMVLTGPWYLKWYSQ